MGGLKRLWDITFDYLVSFLADLAAHDNRVEFVFEPEEEVVEACYQQEEFAKE